MTPRLDPPPIEYGTLARFRYLAQIAPGAPFLAVGDTVFSRAEFLAEVDRASYALTQAGVKSGDVIVLCCANRIEWCVAFWAAVTLGASPAPLDPAIGTWELAQLLPILSPRLAIATVSFRGTSPAQRLAQVMPELPLVTLDGDIENGTRFCDFIRELSAHRSSPRIIAEDEILLYACTSGTTGNPKVLAVPHLGFLRSQIDMGDYLGLSSEDRMLLGMPLFHQGGFGMGLQVLVSGGLARYVETFDPDAFLDCISASSATIVQLSPTLAKLLLTSPHFLSVPRPCWRTAYFAGEMLTDELAATFHRDQRMRVVNVVGSSETGTMLAWDSAVDLAFPPSDLQVLPFTQAQVLAESGRTLTNGETGVLWISTDALLARYEGNPRLTSEAIELQDWKRWFCTGDLVQQLPNGRYRFIGRVKRAIKRGANLVHPEELEAFLLCHPQIAAVAVGKEPHPLIGESIVAWVQPIDGSSLTRADVLTYCREQISSYKIPDRVNFVTSLPTDVGKLQHMRLREVSSSQ